MKLYLVVFIYFIFFLFISCQSDNVNEVLNPLPLQENHLLDSSVNKMVRVKSRGNTIYDLGFFKKELFLDSNVREIKEIQNIYELPIYKGRTSNEEQFRLISHNNIYKNIVTYILFDEFCGESGCYELFTLDSLGFVIDLIEFKGGDDWENGGYSTNSRFTNKDVIIQTIETYDKETDANGEYLNTWTKKITKTEFLIAENGFIYIRNRQDSTMSNLNSRY